jgi:glycosyltransferase involved in cell wall biosynthesis
MNPLREVMVLGQLAGIYLKERPQAVHHFTIKCVLYGTMAAKLTGIKSVVNAVTGLGHIFIGTKWKARVLRPIVKAVYRRILSARRVKVIFQNPDDLKAFSDSRLIVPEQTVIIKGGSGVNLQRFAPRPGHPDQAPAPVVLFASRLIAEKGLHEFVEAARMLKEQGVHATFQIAGTPDPGNPSSISAETLEKWRLEGAVDLLGHVENVDDLIAEATMVVLPSYREGTPRILLEAAAMAKPIVATDVPGCREVVEHQVNGLLVPVKEVNSLAVAIEQMLASPARSREMGEAGRNKMMKEFDDQDVARRTIEVYELTGVVPAAPRVSNKASVA